MMSWWLRLGRGLDRLGDVFIAMSAVMLLLMMVLLGLEIGDRALFKSSTQIADEYSGYLFTWVTMCCFLYAQRTDRLLRVDSLRNRFSPRVRAAADGVAALLAAILTAVLVYATWSTFSVSMQFSSVSIQSSQTPLSIPQVIMPIGFTLLTIAFMHSGITSILQASGRLPPPKMAAAAPASHE
jgi:TRAP-type C4-dicarboxylate transport system permease small subunit